MRRLTVALVVGALILAACSSDDGAGDTTTTEQAGGGEVFEVMFDGVGCEITGPAQVVAGQYPFVMTDVSGMEGADVRTIVIGEGYTYDDVLALQSEPGEYIRLPDWAGLSPITFVPFEGELQENQAVKTLDLEIATHAFSVGTGSPSGVWLCGVLQVTES